MTVTHCTYCDRYTIDESDICIVCRGNAPCTMCHMYIKDHDEFQLKECLQEACKSAKNMFEQYKKLSNKMTEIRELSYQ